MTDTINKLLRSNQLSKVILNSNHLTKMLHVPVLETYRIVLMTVR